MGQTELDFKRFYVAEEALRLRSECTTNNSSRFRRTAAYLPATFDSLLDVGCGEGYWLGFLARKFGTRVDLRGYEYADNRAEATRQRFPHLDVRVGSVFDIPEDDNAFDVVTCLEVLEHLPDWRAGVSELLRVARKEVLLTIPYRETLRQVLCIHCNKLTPPDGHLHSFSEETFAFLRSSYSVTFGHLIGGDAGLLRNTYARLRRRYRWLLVRIRLNG